MQIALTVVVFVCAGLAGFFWRRFSPGAWRRAGVVFLMSLPILLFAGCAILSGTLDRTHFLNAIGDSENAISLLEFGQIATLFLGPPWAIMIGIGYLLGSVQNRSRLP